MRKILILFLFLFILTGCSKSDINKHNYDEIFDTFLSKKTSLVNNYSVGYKYYLPNGVRVTKSNENNDVLYYNGNNYYLYVDVVSYYYKTKIDYTPNNSLFYSKKLDYNDITGYVEISKVDELYKVVVYYNYSKIETYVEKDDIGQTLINICYILNSIKYNDPVIEMSIGSEDTKLNEETYDFYTPRKKEGNFIDYINKYDEYVEDEVVDENNIGNKEE